MTSRKHDVPEELLSQLLANYQNPEDLIGENGLLKELTKRLADPGQWRRAHWYPSALISVRSCAAPHWIRHHERMHR